MGSTDEPNVPEQTLDMNLCERVDQTISRLMETDPPNIGWMSSELAHKLLGAHGSIRTLMMMSLLRAGMPKEQAEEQAAMQSPLLLFELGRRVGKEIESTQALYDIFGDDPPEFPPLTEA